MGDTGAPLSGKGVLVTRPAGQGGELAEGLVRLGARVHCVPAIEVRPLGDGLKRAVEVARGADWLVFTSANGARYFLEAGEVGAGTRVAAIGAATAKVLEQRGVRAELVPEDHRAEGLLDALVARGVAGKRMVLPVAAKTRDVLAPGLEAAGAQVEVCAVYETACADAGATRLRELFAAREIDVVTFTSSSTVDAFRELAAGPLPEGLVYAAIGPVTADTARARGFAPLLVAGTSTVVGLLDALVAHYRKRP